MKLPTSTKHTRPAARIRTVCEDFEVEEVPAYEPSGEGEHLFVWFEKRDFNTPEAVRRLARALGTDPRGAGYAGMKDRRAVTRQWASFHGARDTDPMSLELEGIRVLDAKRHASKLRTGHLVANRFTVRLRGLDPTEDAAIIAGLHTLAAHGMPNYFGDQRFGRDGDNVARAIRWLSGEERAPRETHVRRMLASALQSELFNQAVAERVRADGLGTIRDGEMCRKEDTGGMFFAADVAAEQVRSDAWEISPTGPMFGPEMRWPERAAGDAERALLASAGLSDELLGRLGRNAPGTRRVVRVRPTDVAARREDDALVLAFTLPTGAYATTLLAELVEATEPERTTNGPLSDESEGGDAPAEEGR